MIGERELRLMKPTTHIVNIGRGGTIDEAALIRALREGWIAGPGWMSSRKSRCRPTRAVEHGQCDHHGALCGCDAPLSRTGVRDLP